MVNKEEFLDWRNNQVTDQFRKDTIEAIQVITSKLMLGMTTDINSDNYLKGMIKGLNELVEWVPELSDEV